jgi:CBS-domain-containing membrane protein
LGERPGIITALMRRAASVPVTNAVTAADLMNSDVMTARPDAAIEAVMQEMLARRRKIIPVVDGQGRVIGIVDRFDLLHAIAGPTQRGA